MRVRTFCADLLRKYYKQEIKYVTDLTYSCLLITSTILKIKFECVNNTNMHNISYIA